MLAAITIGLVARYGSPDDSGKSPDETTRFAGYPGSGAGSGHRNSGPPPVPAGPPASPYTTGNAPTQYADAQGYQGRSEQPGFAPGFTEPTPWFRKRPVLITWITLIVVMIALVIWGIIQLASRGPGDITVPATTTSTPSSTPGTTTSPTTRSTTPPATTTAPPPSPSRQAPPPAPPPNEPPNEPPSEPTHRHHRPHLPSEITIPPIPKAPEVPTVITVPPGLR